jgi:hypothetical protein
MPELLLSGFYLPERARARVNSLLAYFSSGTA